MILPCEPEILNFVGWNFHRRYAKLLRGYPGLNLAYSLVIFPLSPDVYHEMNGGGPRQDMHQPFEGGGNPLKFWHELLDNFVFIDTEESHRRMLNTLNS